jgi:hypothetical protein
VKTLLLVCLRRLCINLYLVDNSSSSINVPSTWANKALQLSKKNYPWIATLVSLSPFICASLKGLLLNVWQILVQGLQHDIPDLFGNGTIFDVKDHSRKVIADVQKFLLRSKCHDLAKGGGRRFYGTQANMNKYINRSTS